MALKLISEYFSPFAFFVSLIVAGFLFNSKKGKIRQNRLLAFYFLSFGIMLGSRFLWAQYNYQEHGEIFSVGTNFRFLIAPLFYLYLKAVFEPKQPIRYLDLLHLSVFVIISINHFTVRNILIHNLQFYIIVDVSQMFIYLILAFIQFKLFRLFTNAYKLTYYKAQIIWLRYFVIANIVLLLYLLYALIFENWIYSDTNICFWSVRLIAFTNFIFISSLVYFVLKYPDALFIRPKSIGISEEQYVNITEKLYCIMINDEEWKNPNLSLQILADKIDVSNKILSYVINRMHGANFYRYINTYRVQECKDRLSQDKYSDKTILEIAFAAGFNSKNTFNSAFKKETGMSPTEYRKKRIIG